MNDLVVAPPVLKVGYSIHDFTPLANAGHGTPEGLCALGARIDHSIGAEQQRLRKHLPSARAVFR